MFGTFYNVIMIVIGSLIGAVLEKGLKEAYHTILMQAMGLVAIGLGINAIVQHLPKSEFPILFYCEFSDRQCDWTNVAT